MMSSARRAAVTDIFIQRPIIAIIISLAFIVIGIFSALKLPVLQFPRIESSSLVITTPFVGASAERVQGFITDPIERIAATVPGVDYVDSTTLAGLSTVTVWLKLNENSTAALAELTARLQQIRFELPAGAEDPAIQVNRADKQGAGFYLDVPVTGTLTRASITDYLTRNINPQLAAIPGVQRIGIEGGRAPAMRIWLDPSRLQAFNLGANDIDAALRANNLIATLGRSENSWQRIDLLANTTLQTADDFEQLIIKDNGGAQIRLRDVARIELGEVEGENNARMDNNNAVYISVWPLPGANEIDIADALYKKLAAINKTLPDGMHIGIGYDITLYMRSALREIFQTLAETILLVGIVVLALMGSARTALVPLVTIPISLLGAIAAMLAMGFSLNLLTVLAIVLSVGLVVDDAIVVVENVARHMREGKSRIDAALASSRQLIAPIIGMTITLAAVYAPIGFLSGLTGVLFKEFAFTLAIAVLISGVVALTLSPIMSAYACPPQGQESRMTQTVNRWFALLQQRYTRALAHCLSWQPQVLAAALFFSLLVVPFYWFSQQELAPVEDQSSINVVIEAPPQASLAYTTHYMKDIVNVLNALPGASFMWQIVTPQGGFGGQTFVDFKQREYSVQELLARAYVELGTISGLRALPILYPALPTAGNFDVEMVVMSSDTPQQMKVYADKLVAFAKSSQKFLYADTDLKIDLPQAEFLLDRQRIADLGMDLNSVSQQLGVLLSANYVNRFDLDGKAYQVIPMLTGNDRPDPQSLLNLQLRTPRGERVALSAIATLQQHTAPRVLGKFQQNNAFRIYGGAMPGTTKAQSLAALEAAAREILPSHYSIDYAGESRQLRHEGNTLFGVLLIALLFVFFVLAIQFNSFRDPLVVLLGSVPLALAGAMLFTFLGWTTINIFSQVGFITLVGLISKNGILIVEFANHLQQQGLHKFEAITQAAATRLRPVLMTTGATVLGHFPLVLVSGPGAEARNSIGIILVAGMLVGTLFTLFVLPAVYLLIAAGHHENLESEAALDDAISATQG